jgi:hypothetical protein
VVIGEGICNFFRENNLSGKPRNRAGGMILDNKKPIPPLPEEDGLNQ